jgi:DNA-binding XRE family transcriptional regulator
MIYNQSDKQLLEQVGTFVRQTRIGRSLTQQQLAASAGVNRSTISQIEKGESITLLNLIQILRTLQRLDILAVFQTQSEISPLQVAEAKMKIRKRVRAKSTDNNTKKSDW